MPFPPPAAARDTLIGLIGHRDLGDAQAVARIRQEAEHHFRHWQTCYPRLTVLSSLAIGADTLLAEVALEQGCRLIAVIPFAGYEHEFSPSERTTFHALCARAAEVIHLPRAGRSTEAFQFAGQWIVDHADLLLVAWDGLPSPKIGGTAGAITYARAQRKPLVTIHVPRQGMSESRG